MGIRNSSRRLRHVAQARAYSRRNGDEVGTLAGIAELDELDIANDEDDE
jgi:hypothetical protein